MKLANQGVVVAVGIAVALGAPRFSVPVLAAPVAREATAPLDLPPTPDASSTPDAPSALPSDANAVSLTAHLQLSNAQIEQLDRLFDDYAPRRSKQDAQLSDLYGQREAAQAPESFDAANAARLTRQVSAAQEKLAKDFLAVRAGALATLTPVQRAQLQAIVTDARFIWRQDKYALLLVAPLAAGPLPIFERPNTPNEPSDAEAEHPGRETMEKRRRSRGHGRYDVVAGYGYGGAQYGVYGSYGQGPVGVYAGVGRGGPSVGVSIGGGFGLGLGGVFGSSLRPR